VVLEVVRGRGAVARPLFVRWAVLTAAGLALAVFMGVLLTAAVAGQEASPPPGLLPPGDPRSEGSGPGLGSGPLLAAVVVIGLGLAAGLATFALARLSARR
jgi:hypothetical protein